MTGSTKVTDPARVPDAGLSGRPFSRLVRSSRTYCCCNSRSPDNREEAANLLRRPAAALVCRPFGPFFLSLVAYSRHTTDPWAGTAGHHDQVQPPTASTTRHPKVTDNTTASSTPDRNITTTPDPRPLTRRLCLSVRPRTKGSASKLPQGFISPFTLKEAASPRRPWLIF